MNSGARAEEPALPGRRVFSGRAASSEAVLAAGVPFVRGAVGLRGGAARPRDVRAGHKPAASPPQIGFLLLGTL